MFKDQMRLLVVMATISFGLPVSAQQWEARFLILNHSLTTLFWRCHATGR